MDNIENICLGHIKHQTKRCKGCISDEWNKRCPEYQPVYVIFYKVRPAEAVTEYEEKPKDL